MGKREKKIICERELVKNVLQWKYSHSVSHTTAIKLKSTY